MDIYGVIGKLRHARRLTNQPAEPLLVRLANILLLAGIVSLSSCANDTRDQSETRAAALQEIMGGAGASLERGLQRQDAIVAEQTDCMVREGFELEEFSHLLITRENFEGEAERQAKLEQEASENGKTFRQYFGFGITTTSLPVEFRQFGLKTGLTSFATLNSDSDQQPPGDAGSREAVSRAFFGSDGEQGCFDVSLAAIEESYPEVKYADRVGQEVDQRLQADERVTSALAERDRCLAEQGHDPPDMEISVLQSDFRALESEAVSQFSSDEDLTSATIEKLAEIQGREVDISDIIAECDRAADLDAIVFEVSQEIYRELSGVPDLAEIADSYAQSK